MSAIVSSLKYPPGPRNLFPLQQLPAFQKDTIAYMIDVRRRYGSFAHLRIGRDHLFFLSEPEAIKQVLVTDQRHFVKSRGVQMLKPLLGEGLLTAEGESHLRQRRLVQPAFHRQRIEGYGQSMAEYSRLLAARWQPGQTVDVSHEMMQLTLAIVSKTLFDANVDDEADEIGAALTESMQAFIRRMSLLGPLLERLPLPGTRRSERARARLDQTIYRIIEARRRSGEDRGDLLSTLLTGLDDEGDGTGLTDVQVRDEAMTLFLAGHETTANLLTWTWYLLSQNPDAEARLHAELDNVLAGRVPEPGDMPNLPYVRKVLSESLRLYPPAYVIGRQPKEDYELLGYRVPAGSPILMSQYVVHRDPRYYPDPEHFDPERWTPEEQARRPRFAFFPFGGGTRVCIGEQFAWLEGSLALSTLAQCWRLQLQPGHPVALQPLVTLRPKYGMRMQLERRG